MFTRLSSKLVLLFSVVAAVGCTSGPMDVEERYYLKVTNGADNAYIRINVKAETHLSDAQYNSGWFDAEAVDAAFGAVGADPTGKTRATRDAMQDAYNEAFKLAQENLIETALNPNTDDAAMTAALQRWENIRRVPDGVLDESQSGFVAEYNPTRGLETVRSDEKLIFVLSANPDVIIESINSFANSQDTKAAIQKLAGTIIAREKAEIESQEGVARVAAKADMFVAARADALLAAIENNQRSRDAAIEDLKNFQALLRGLDRTGG